MATIKAKVGRMTERYGRLGAALVIAGIVALIVVPVPGTSLLPIGLAELVLRVRG